MSSFAVAHLRSTTRGPGVADYLARIDATLQSHDGRFVVHGSRVEVLEGPWQGDLVVIEFPDHDQAKAWYTSPSYQQILALRTANSDGTVILVDRVADQHHATDNLHHPQQSPLLLAHEGLAVPAAVLPPLDLHAGPAVGAGPLHPLGHVVASCLRGSVIPFRQDAAGLWHRPPRRIDHRPWSDTTSRSRCLIPK